MTLFSGGGGEPDYTAQAQLAEIAQEVYDDYVARFRPIELELAGEALGTYDSSMGDVAAADAGAATEVSRGAFYRNASRAGLSLSPDMRADAEARFGRQNVLNRVGARNLDRRAFQDRTMALLGGLSASGRRLQSGAVSRFSQVSSLESQRNQYNAGVDAQRAQSRANMIGTGIGIGAALLFCWVARAAFGHDNLMWRAIRRRMLALADADFVAWYRENGENMAALLEMLPDHKPAVQTVLLRMMGSWQTA